MKSRILKVITIMALFVSYQSCGQDRNYNEIMQELQPFLKIGSNDKSILEMTKNCDVLDTEWNGQTYQYNWKDVDIKEPKKNDKNIYEIILLCNGTDECILAGSREEIYSKNFLIRSKSTAEDVFRLLEELQRGCDYKK